MSDFQRFVDEVRAQFEAATMTLDTIQYFGIPDETDKYRLEVEFEDNHPSANAMEDFVQKVSNDMPGAITYTVQSVRRQKNDEYVFIVQASY